MMPENNVKECNNARKECNKECQKIMKDTRKET